MEELRARLSLEDQVHLARFAVRIGGEDLRKYIQELTEALFERIKDPQLDPAARTKAAELAIAAQPESIDTPERLLALATPQSPPEFSASLIRALQASRAPRLGPVVIEQAATMAPATRDAALDLLLSRPVLTAALLNAIDEGSVRASELSLLHKQRLNDYPDLQLRQRASEILARNQEAITEGRREVLAQYADVALVSGDSANGKIVFTKNCAICHKLRGEGAAVGPDLSGMAVHGKGQLLVHILDPNRDIEENYVTYTALRVDGLVVNGMLMGESAASIDLVDAEGKRHALLREDIESLSRSGVSLMPEGFEKQLSRSELGDLLAYLMDNAGFVPIDLHRAATISSARGMFHSPDSTIERLVLDDWGLKSVNGVPFYPIDPQNGRIRNMIMLHSPRGAIAPTMPRSVELICGGPAKAIHLLSGVSGWGFPVTSAGTVSMIVRLRYADGETEDHELKNGVHFADYLGATDVEASERAFSLGQQQMRYIKIEPKRRASIDAIQLIKGVDETAPLVMAVTAEQD